MSSENKIIFANQMRGIAALCVVLSHLGAVFWGARSIVGAATGAPPIDGPTPWIASLFISPHLNLGILGVAAFFLISGFVIPFSLHKTGRVAFIVARFFRIYPTYTAGLLVVLAAVWLSCRYWGSPLPWGPGVVIQNLTLVNSLTGVPSIDLVNWTLSIEVKFYLVCCILATSIRKGSIWTLVAASCAIFLVNLVWRTALGTELEFVIFMFIGVIFNYLMRGLIQLRTFATTAAILCGFFFFGWGATPWPHYFSMIAPNYAYAIAIFGLAYMNRSRFRNFLLLDFLADISYPLYVTHSLIGYIAMRYMFAQKIPAIIVTPITAALILVIAYLIHRLVELPATAIGKRSFFRVPMPA